MKGEIHQGRKPNWQKHGSVKPGWISANLLSNYLVEYSANKFNQERAVALDKGLNKKLLEKTDWGFVGYNLQLKPNLTFRWIILICET